MTKTLKHIGLDEQLAAAITRYAEGHGISFTAAISLLAARGLRDEGITLNQPAEEGETT